MRISFLIIFLFIGINLFAQTDYQRWEKKPYNLTKENLSVQREYKFTGDNAVDFVVTSGISLYWFFISDLDGANCPYEPSCSSFLVQSIKKTNPLTGTILFFDRFTRDMNLFDRDVNYPITKRGQLYDPPEHYIFN